MPNHVTNILIADQEVLDFLKSAESDVDFSTVLPIPDDRDPIFTASFTDYGNGMTGWGVDGFSPLGWATRNWGTKWNAYKISTEEGSVTFQTAWSHPMPVIEELSRKFPEKEIKVKYADEDMGYNIGIYTILDGQIIEDNSPAEGSDEALDMGAQMYWGAESYKALMAEWGEEDE